VNTNQKPWEAQSTSIYNAAPQRNLKLYEEEVACKMVMHLRWSCISERIGRSYASTFKPGWISKAVVLWNKISKCIPRN
jgi:hypothetical protein